MSLVSSDGVAMAGYGAVATPWRVGGYDGEMLFGSARDDSDSLDVVSQIRDIADLRDDINFAERDWCGSSSSAFVFL